MERHHHPAEQVTRQHPQQQPQQIIKELAHARAITNECLSAGFDRELTQDYLCAQLRSVDSKVDFQDSCGDRLDWPLMR